MLLDCLNEEDRIAILEGCKREVCLIGMFAAIFDRWQHKIIALIDDKDGGSVDSDLYWKERIRILTLVSELHKRRNCLHVYSSMLEASWKEQDYLDVLF